MDLIFATHNQNKVDEVDRKLGPYFNVNSLSEIGWLEDIPETADSLRGNAVLKARAVYHEKRIPVFADDTGLEIDTLDGRPGVYSARYAGLSKSAAANMEKVLAEMRFADNRQARFKTAIALIIDNETYVFEGHIEGHITMDRRGEGGFGYDPIFVPVGHDRTFAQMSMEEKNTMSHRALAVDKLIRFLHKLL